MKQVRIAAVTAVGALLAVLIAAATVSARDDISEHRDCLHCGMDRKAFGFSRMLITYADGLSVGVCSLHCAAVELGANPARTVKTIEVADRDTRALISAQQAFWVMGGKKQGVMTQRPKWAFASKASAEAFVAANGGKLVTWDEALSAAREDIHGSGGKHMRK